MARKSPADPAAKPRRLGSDAVVAKLVSEGFSPQRRATTVAKESMNRAQTSVVAVIERAADMGLMTTSNRQVGARLPLKLLEQAKKRTGIKSTTDLLAFALANVALEDNFASAWIASRGKLDPDLDIGL